MHFTCSICTATSWDQVIFKEVSPHEEKKTSVDFWKDHLYVKFPQCLPGGNRRIGKFGWTARSTGERKSTILSLQTGLSGIKCKPLSGPGVVPDSCGVRGWERQAFLPVHTYSYLWSKRCTTTRAAQIMCLGDANQLAWHTLQTSTKQKC